MRQLVQQMVQLVVKHDKTEENTDEMLEPMIPRTVDVPNGLDAMSAQSSHIFKILPYLEDITIFSNLESIFQPTHNAKGKALVINSTR